MIDLLSCGTKSKSVCFCKQCKYQNGITLGYMEGIYTPIYHFYQTFNSDMLLETTWPCCQKLEFIQLVKDCIKEKKYFSGITPKCENNCCILLFFSQSISLFYLCFVPSWGACLKPDPVFHNLFWLYQLFLCWDTYLGVLRNV